MEDFASTPGSPAPANPLPKTAFVAHWFPKPSETFVFREVQGLWERGLPLVVFSLYGPLRQDLSPEMRATRIPVERMGAARLRSLLKEVDLRLLPGPARRLLRPFLPRRWRDLELAGENFWALGAGFWLARRCRELGVGHLHAAWASGPATSAWIASRLTGIPFSFSARAVDIYPPDPFLGRKLEAAVFIRTESRATPGHLARLAPDCRGKIFPVPAPLTLVRGEMAGPRSEAPFRILAVGRMVPKKGFRFLVRGCGLLVREGWDIRLDLVGWGPEARRLKALARELGLAGRIRFPGFVSHDRMADYYSRADIFVMPSLVTPRGDRDGLPNALVEAMSRGLPVVATDVSGIGEVVRNNETGVLVDRSSPRDLARGVARLLGDREGAGRMGVRARELVNRVFDQGRNARRLMELFAAHSRTGPRNEHG